MSAFDVLMTSILLIAIESMALQFWLDRGAKHMPRRLRAWLSGEIRTGPRRP